jgi:type IV secretion system protein VirD4
VPTAKGIRLGYNKALSEVIRYKGEAHLITVAPTRSGKGRDVLIPALLEYEGSCIVIDPKGQLAAVTGPQRARMGQQVKILNPFKILPDVLSADSPDHFRGIPDVDDLVTFDGKFNPMAALDPASESFGADCDNIADSIVTHESGRESHWADSARSLVAGLIMKLAETGNPKIANLSMVRDLIAGPDADLATFAFQAVKNGNPFIKQKLARFADEKATNANEVASIISTAKTQTTFIGNTAIANCLSGPGFRFRELKFEPITVYLVLPTRYLATCGKWFRLILAAALDDLLREEKGQYPVLAIMDEFAQLGRLAVIENAMGLAAGYGLQIWPVLQDLTRLKEQYRDSWETFLGNAGIQQFFAPRENTTSNYVSELCGETTVYTTSETKGTSTNSGRGFLDGTSGKNEGVSTNPTQRRAMLPQDVRRLDRNQSLMFSESLVLPDKSYIIAGRKPYFEIEEFKGLYSPDPYYYTEKDTGASWMSRPTWSSK